MTVAVVAGALAATRPDFVAWRPEDWSALAAWVTAIVAVVAGTVAWRQLSEARRLRVEQAQPYVAVYMDRTPGHDHFIDLVVRNFGTTVARDIRLQITPQPRRAVQGNDPEDVWLPAGIPALVPGQEWRTWWDFSPQRFKTELPDRHDALVSYSDSQHKELPSTPSVLDWAAYRGRLFVSTYGAHDAAVALQEIGKTLGSWQENIHGGHAVFVGDGTANQRGHEYLEALRAKQRADPGTQDQQGSP